jgi:hypothetical protein
VYRISTISVSPVVSRVTVIASRCTPAFKQYSMISSSVRSISFQSPKYSMSGRDGFPQLVPAADLPAVIALQSGRMADLDFFRYTNNMRKKKKRRRDRRRFTESFELNYAVGVPPPPSPPPPPSRLPPL